MYLHFRFRKQKATKWVRHIALEYFKTHPLLAPEIIGQKCLQAREIRILDQGADF